MLAICLRCLVPNSYTVVVAVLTFAAIFLTSNAVAVKAAPASANCPDRKLRRDVPLAILHAQSGARL